MRLLALDGFQVDCAQSGAEGLTRAATRPYDAIVLDLRLPDMFGLAVLKHFTDRGVSAPVLVITGYFLEPQTEHEAVRAGATAFRYKPLTDASDLGALLRSMTSRSSSRAGMVRSTGEMRRYPAEAGHQPPIGQVLEALRRMLRRRFPQAPDDLVNDAAEDSILDYLHRPEQFDGARGTALTSFLRPSAARNLQNLLQADARRRARESSYAGEQMSQPLSETFREIDRRDILERLRRRALTLTVDDRERQALLKWLDGDRSTASLAQALGLSDRTLSERAREVKRFKDRFLKRLLRSVLPS